MDGGTKTCSKPHGIWVTLWPIEGIATTKGPGLRPERAFKKEAIAAREAKGLNANKYHVEKFPWCIGIPWE